jgi:preprotein translocase subunit YajC
MGLQGPLIAQAAESAPVWLNFMPMFAALAVVMLYVMLISRPQRREQENRRQMLRSVKKNDRVLTNSGIYGVVTNVQPDADEVTIRVDETSNTRLRMTLSSIAQIFGDESASDKETK